jgi:hypothetical protein
MAKKPFESEPMGQGEVVYNSPNPDNRIKVKKLWEEQPGLMEDYSAGEIGEKRTMHRRGGRVGGKVKNFCKGGKVISSYGR